MQKRSKATISYLLIILAIFIAIYNSIKAAANKTFWSDEVLANLLSRVPESMDPFFLTISELGDKKGIGIVALIVLGWLLLIKRNYVGAAAITLATALGNEVSKLIKEIIARPRPELEHLASADSNSFPSGHAMVGIIFYFFIAYFIIEGMKSKTGNVIVAISVTLLLILIGASRIILNVHYPSDVIGGFAYGYIWVVIWIFLYQFSKNRKEKRL